MNPDRHFCTLFDRNYLLKGIVMLDSLVRHCPEATIHVLCMDQITHRLLGELHLPAVKMLQLVDVEDEDLLRVKPGRSVAEYCWTLTASLCWHILQTLPEVQKLTYVDADLMFFSDVEPLFTESANASIAIIEHRFGPQLSYLEAYGRFNVEWVGFRRTAAGLDCLRIWRNQCIEWCYARLEEGRIGDQKYLDEWPANYGNDVHILQHAGAGIAPWNFANYCIVETDGRITINETPLIFYHFHQFQIIAGGQFNRVSDLYADRVPIPAIIYERYEQELLSALRRVRCIDPQFNSGIRRRGAVLARRLVQRMVPVGVKNVLRRFGIQPW